MQGILSRKGEREPQRTQRTQRTAKKADMRQSQMNRHPEAFNEPEEFVILSDAKDPPDTCGNPTSSTPPYADDLPL
jgi:hypothetical protein